MGAPAASIPADFLEHSRILFDLMTLAFQTDMTRVMTALLAIEQSPRSYAEIGIPEAHHGLTHHQGDTKNGALWRRSIATMPGSLVSCWTGEVEGDARRRWHATGSLHDRLWQWAQ